MKLSEIKKIINIEVIEEGTFNSLGMLSDKEKNDTLVFIEDIRFIQDLQSNPSISAVLCSSNIVEKIRKLNNSIGIAVSENPKRDFFLFHNYLVENTDFYGRKKKTESDATAKIHETAFIADYNVFIGKNIVIHPHVVILENVKIGDDCIIWPNVTLGSEGFEQKKIGDMIIPVKHDGWVIIGDRVEIQANCAVAKGVYGKATLIGNDSKLDQLIHVPHSAIIGERSRIAAGVTLAGSCQIGDDVFIGPGATISSQVKVGNNSYITLGSVVTRDVPEGQRVTGNFAIDHKKFISFIKSIR